MNGQVLFSKLNPHIPRVWYVNDMYPYRKVASTEFLALNIKNTTNILPTYLREILSSKQFIKFVVSSVSSASKSHSRANTNYILGIQVPLPPLEVQRTIVSEIFLFGESSFTAAVIAFKRCLSSGLRRKLVGLTVTPRVTSFSFSGSFSGAVICASLL